MLWAVSAHSTTITKLTNGANGAEANGSSINPSVSADGRYAVFESTASNLIDGDLNNSSDIFLVDTANGTIQRISEPAGGGDASGSSNNPSISANGQFIVFESFAPNLVANDTNNAVDIFIYDRLSQSLERVSVASNNTEGNSHSFSPSVSADGRFVTFYSISSNLAAGDNNRAVDVFVRDRNSGETRIVSTDSNGNPGNMASWQPVISADGQFIAFSSNASNLVSGDTNGVQDIFLYEMSSTNITMLSKANDGTPGNALSAYPAISASGDYVVFESDASNLVSGDGNGLTDVFVADVLQSSVTRISITTDGGDSNAPAYQPRISQDGRFVSYYTYASNIVQPDPNDVEDVFLYDQHTGAIDMITRTAAGEPSNGSSFTAALNSDGLYVITSSLASNFDPADTNDLEDIYLFDRGTINTPPVANAGNDIDIVLGTTAHLDGTASSDPDGDSIISYQWQMVSAPAASSLGYWTSALATPSLVPDLPGTYIISLVVGDGVSLSVTDEMFINVSQNLPPSALATADTTEGYAPLTVSFDGSQSSDPEGSALQFNWSFSEGATSTEVSPVHVFSTPGQYNILLTVTDPLGNTDQAVIPITVLSVNQVPVINDLTVTPESGPAPLTVSLSAIVVDPENDSLSIVWDLGDGTVVHDTTNLTHTYYNKGTYNGTVTVSDGQSTAHESFVVSVGDGFNMKKPYIDMHIHHRKPYRSKFRLKTRFELDATPAANDPVRVIINDVTVLDKKLDEFKEVIPGIYYYREKYTYVVLDLKNDKLQLSKRHFSMTSDNFAQQAMLRLVIGMNTAAQDVRLFKKNRCDERHYQLNQYDDSNVDEAQCPVTTIKTAHRHKHHYH
jgi:PKD repeat protein